MRSSTLSTALAALVASSVAAVPPLAGQEGAPPPPDSLELSEVLALAEAQSPMLRAIRASAAAAAAREPEPSTLPDPMLEVGFMNFGLPDFRTDMPTSMTPSVQLRQMIPFPGKLGLMGKVASYSREMADADALEEAWRVRREVAAHFFELYATDRSLEVMRETLSLLEDFQDVAEAMYVSGSGRQADVLRADVEAARMDADIQRMEAMRIGLAARLNAMLGRPADTAVPTPSLGSLPLDLPEREVLKAWAHDSRPRLARDRLAVDRARAEVDLAARELWPDVTVGLGYGQRAAEMGTERMGSAMIELSLPVHAGRRQRAMRREAVAMEDMARADLEATEVSLDAAIGGLLADLGRARRLAELYQQEVIPQAHAAVESALSSYRVGSVDFMTLLDAQMAANGYDAELYQLLAEYGTAIAALESEIGRELPRNANTLRDRP